MISVVIICKDDARIDGTLTTVEDQLRSLTEPGEIVVVDASSGRLEHIRDSHMAVRWIDFKQPEGVRVTIPHQRNAGVREAHGDIIVFTDAACYPHPGWLEKLVAALRQDEQVAGGIVKDSSGQGLWEIAPDDRARAGSYVLERGTGNMAFHRDVFDAVGGFDEDFPCGEDIDFSWRLNDFGYRIRLVPDAIVEHDWGTPRRNRHRSYIYGKARAHLYLKHRNRRRNIVRNDPMCIVYPLFLLGLPLTLVFPIYPLLLLIPAWRYRSGGARRAIRVTIENLFFGAGFLAGLSARAHRNQIAVSTASD